MFRIGSLVGRMAGLSLGNSTVLTRAAGASQLEFARPISFLVKVNAEDLWRGVTSVSNAGRKRGRASGASRKMAKDLNKGQRIGEGKVNMAWPGLNMPAVQRDHVFEIKELPPNEEREKRILSFRNQQTGNFRRIAIDPLERGWSGTKAPGRSLGAPMGLDGVEHADFNSVILSLGLVSHMTGHLGRVKRHKAVVAVGNGRGLLGFAASRGSDARTALRRAKNSAFQHLCYYPVFDNHTVMHDFFSTYGHTRIYVAKKQRGFGIVTHRAIKELCKLIGIKDIYAKVDTRNTNLLNLIRAFLLGLQNQKTHQEIADEKRLHVVEFRPEKSYFPEIVASPKDAPLRKDDEIGAYEELNIERYISGGKIMLRKPKQMPFYTRLPGWETYLKKVDKLKNERKVRLRLTMKYGTLKSFINERAEQNQPLGQRGANGDWV